MKNDRL